MKYRQFGQSGLTVSEVGFGTWTVSTTWWGIKDEAVGVRLLQQAFNQGVTLIDTADTYGNGLGETIVAKALGQHRDELIIATKFGYDFYHYGDKRTGQQELPHDFSPEFVRFALEQSLRRLNTDYIDIYQMHNVRKEHIENDQIFDLLNEFKKEGKIRAYGVALGPAIGWREEGLLALRQRRANLHMIHNMLEQEPGRDLLAAAKEVKAGVLVRVPHSSGLLEGKYTAETTFDPSDHRSHRKREWLIDGLKKLERLRFLHEGRDITIGQAALKYLLADASIASVLPNIYNDEQLREFVAMSDKPDMTDEEVAMVNALYDENYGLPKPEAAELASAGKSRS